MGGWFALQAEGEKSLQTAKDSGSRQENLMSA